MRGAAATEWSPAPAIGPAGRTDHRAAGTFTIWNECEHGWAGTTGTRGERDVVGSCKDDNGSGKVRIE